MHLDDLVLCCEACSAAITIRRYFLCFRFLFELSSEVDAGVSIRGALDSALV